MPSIPDSLPITAQDRARLGLTGDPASMATAPAQDTDAPVASPSTVNGSTPEEIPVTGADISRIVNKPGSTFLPTMDQAKLLKDYEDAQPNRPGTWAGQAYEGAAGMVKHLKDSAVSGSKEWINSAEDNDFVPRTFATALEAMGRAGYSLGNPLYRTARRGLELALDATSRLAGKGNADDFQNYYDRLIENLKVSRQSEQLSEGKINVLPSQITDYVKPYNGLAEIGQFVAGPESVASWLKAGGAGALEQAAIAAGGKSMAGKVLAKTGQGMETAGGIMRTAGGLPEDLVKRGAGMMLGDEAAQQVENALKTSHVASGIAAVGGAHGLAAIPAAAKTLATAGDVVEGAGQAAQRIANTEGLSQWSRLQQIAKDTTAPQWMRTLAGVANKPIGQLAEGAANLAGEVGKHALIGGGIGGGLELAAGSNQDQVASAFGGGAALGAGARLALDPLIRRQQLLQAKAADIARFYNKQSAFGLTPEFMAQHIGDETMLQAATLDKVFDGRLDIRFVDADTYGKLTKEAGSAGAFVDTGNGKQILINAESKRGPQNTFLHEIGHALAASEVASTPQIKLIIDQQLGSDAPAKLEELKREYAQRLVEGQMRSEGIQDPQSALDLQARAEAMKARLDGESAVKNNGDQNHWIYSELYAEHVVNALGGKDIYNLASPSLTGRALDSMRQILGAVGMPFKETGALDGTPSDLFSGKAQGVMDSPELRKLTYKYVRDRNNYLSGLKKPSPEPVATVPKAQVGKHEAVPLHTDSDPQGRKGNDFYFQTDDQTIHPRTPKETRKLVGARQAEVEAATDKIPPAAADDTSGNVSLRKTISGLLQVTGTKLGKWFYDLKSYGPETKANAKLFENAMANGQEVNFWYHPAGSGKGAAYRESLAKAGGGLEVTNRRGLPFAYVVSKKGEVIAGGKKLKTGGNVSVNMLDMTTADRKAYRWQAENKLALWGGDVNEFRKDLITYLKNHANGLPGETTIGLDKRNALNAFMVGDLVTHRDRNALRAALRGDDRSGIVRSFRLDRIESPKFEGEKIGQGNYDKKALNLSPDVEDNRLRDKEGNVRTYYHGSRELEGALKTGAGTDQKRFLHEEGIWFAPNQGTDHDSSWVSDATRYSGDHGTMVKAELSLKNPYRGSVEDIVSDKINAQWLRDHGYDGFIDDKTGSGMVAVLDPSQVMETGRAKAVNGKYSFDSQTQIDNPDELKEALKDDHETATQARPAATTPVQGRLRYPDVSGRDDGDAGNAAGEGDSAPAEPPGQLQQPAPATPEEARLAWLEKEHAELSAFAQERPGSASGRGALAQARYIEGELDEIRAEADRPRFRGELQERLQAHSDAYDAVQKEFQRLNPEGAAPNMYASQYNRIARMRYYDGAMDTLRRQLQAKRDAFGPQRNFQYSPDRDKTAVKIPETGDKRFDPLISDYNRLIGTYQRIPDTNMGRGALRQAQNLKLQIDGLRNDVENENKGVNATVNAPDFKKWFAGSQVVDEAGKPLVVYHGGRSGVTKFKIQADRYKTGMFFSSERGTGESFAKWNEGSTYAALLSLKKPFVVDAGGESYDNLPVPEAMRKNAVGDVVDANNIAEWAYEHGYDGAVIKNVFEGNLNAHLGDDYVVFNSSQVKVVNEKTGFSRRKNFQYSPDIEAKNKRLPNEELRALGAGYKAERGITTPPHTGYEPVNEDLAKKLADAYERAPHAPENPEVKKAYAALGKETRDQWDYLTKAGIKMEPWTKEGQPYTSSADMRRDLTENKHVYYFPSAEGFGQGEAREANPMMAPSGVVIGGRDIPVNDLFRAVHDVFGHGPEGYEFGPRGEYNAYLAHSRMFSDEARPALAAETLAQNSWVNYGKHLRDEAGNIPKKGEPGFIPQSERPFAEQKATAVPKELVDEATQGKETSPMQLSPDTGKGKDHAWPKDFPKIEVHTTVSSLKAQPGYEAAKAGDAQAAHALALSVVKPEKLAALVKKYPDAIVVPVRAEEAKGRNKLASMLAHVIANQTSWELGRDIVQVHRTFHTGADALTRMLNTPEFEGPVKAGANYILADDVVTSGSTLNALRRFIQDHGGKVVGATALAASAHPQTGYGGHWAIQKATLGLLKRKFDVPALERLLSDYGIAKNIGELTNSQGRYLATHGTLDALRSQFASAGVQPSGGLGAGGIGEGEKAAASGSGAQTDAIKKSGHDNQKENRNSKDSDPNPQGEARLRAVEKARDRGGDEGSATELSGPTKSVRKLVLRHWSSKPGLDVLDPKYHGTGIPGAEKARRLAYPDDYVPRIYFGNTGYVKEPALGNHVYTHTVDAGMVYDYQKDPGNLYPKPEDVENAGHAATDIHAARTLYEKRIKQAGYLGYFYRSSKVTALFHKAPVNPAK